MWGGSDGPLLSKVCRQRDRCLRIFSAGNIDDNIYCKCTLRIDYCRLKKYLNISLELNFTSTIDFEEIYFLNYFINELHCCHDYETRFSSAGNLNVPRFRLSVCQHSFLYKAVHCWNDIPSFIKDSKYLTLFKSRLRKLYYCSGAVSNN